MAKKSDDNSDGLEIISIGKLYSGPWDKKYWSSSRGKDRNPYPVGYQAIRTHNTITFRMEISEGLKGPLFTISSTDGMSCSGQTPDIAWESFQKKGCPRMKFWRGKRFSGKIDGVEFFGFKNAFVQRLLRELVANVSGTAEPSLPSSSICSGASKTHHPTPCLESRQYPDLLPFLAKPQVAQKRSKKCRTTNLKLIPKANAKRLRSPERVHNDNASGSENKSTRNGEKSSTSSVSKEESALCNTSGVSLDSRNITTISEQDNNLNLSNNAACFDYSNHLKEEILQTEDTEFISSKNCMAAVAENLSKDEDPVDRSKAIEIRRNGSSDPVKEKDGGRPFPKDSQINNEVHLCVPDTLDLSLDALESSHTTPKEVTHDVPSELITSEMVVSETMETESHPEEQEVCSEKGEFDSVGQEIAKSMMTVLLPRALPLLKTFSRKKKNTGHPSKTSLQRKRSRGKNKGSHLCEDLEASATLIAENYNVQSQKDKMHGPSADVELCLPSGQLTSVVPDSFESDQFVHPVSNHLPPCTDIAEADQTCSNNGIDKAEFIPDMESKLTTESALGQTSLQERDVSIDKDKKPILLEFNKEQKDAETLPGSAEDGVASEANVMHIEHSTPLLQNGIGAKPGGASTGSISCNTHPEAMGPSLASDNCVKKFSGHIPDKSSLVDEDEQDVQSHRFSMTKNTTYHEGAFPSMDNDITSSQDKLMCAKNSSDTSNFLHPSISGVDESLAYDDNKLLKQLDLVESSWLQKKETSFCPNVTENMEVKDGSVLTVQGNMNCKSGLGKVLELVGCYIHPLPISFVLLSTHQNEIYMCVLCGHSVEDRILFIYKTPVEGKRTGYPTLIGHTPLMSPISTDFFGREIALDNSSLQFSPEGMCLVLLNNIKTPCCREAKIQCPCSSCASDCFEMKTIKIVQVKLGYVSVLTKLQAADDIRYVLVCEPGYLVAAEESGRLHLWVMNSTWSANTEECYLPSSNCMPPCIVELKKIPKCAALIVGHNGLGEFSLWNIHDRTLLSSYSAPQTSIFRFLPVSFFRWQRSPVCTGLDIDNHMNKIMDATNKWFLDRGESHSFLPVEGDDVGIWLLVSTATDIDDQTSYMSTDSQFNPIVCWRLALLMKKTLILGSTLDPRATEIGTSAGHGIIGTHDGLVYLWELSTGTKLCNLHCFKACGVSCIAADDSGSGALAVAGDGGQLFVYFHSENQEENK